MKYDINKLIAKISQLQRRLEFAERTANIGYWELDLITKKFYWSKEMYRIFGVQRKIDYSHHNLIRELIFHDDLPIYKQKLKKLIQDEEPVSGLVRLKKKDNKIIYCQFNADRLVENDSLRIVGTFQDVSNLIERQKELEIAHEEAQKAVVARNYFLAQASHDLRQPLQAIRLLADALLEENLTWEQKQIASKITTSISRLGTLLDDFLDVSKLDAGGFEAKYECFDLQGVICKVCMEYRLLGKHNIICKNYSIKIYSDEILIERVVRNLLSNAFKFAKSKILIHTSKEKNYLILRVIDDGCGIKKNYQDKVFDDFYQADKWDSGSGLGLGIVMRIVKILGGRIKLRSKYGFYCTFEVVLPLWECED